MVIGRTEDRNTPGNPLGRRPRRDVWDPIRVTHLGPRSTWPHIKAGHMTAIDQTRPRCKVLAKRGPSTQGFPTTAPVPGATVAIDRRPNPSRFAIVADCVIRSLR